MWQLKIPLWLLAALCLIAFAATSASAAQPIWVVCRESPAVEAGGWSNSSCNQRSGALDWETAEPTETVEVTSSSKGKIDFIDTKATGGEAEIACTVSGSGWVGKGGADSTAHVTATGCERVAGICEAGKTVDVSAIDLPWSTELRSEANGEVRDRLQASSKGPGFKVECEVFGVLKVADECFGGTTTKVRSSGHEVEMEYEGKSEKVECTSGGKEAGELTGTSTVDAKGGLQDLDVPSYFVSETGEFPTKSTITASNVKILEAGPDTVTCGKVEYASELKAASTTVAFKPTYSECKADVGGKESSATITPGSCQDELSNVRGSTSNEAELLGQESIGPSGCGPIKIEDPEAKCTFSIGAQGPDEGTSFKPNGEAGIEVNSTISNATTTISNCSEAKNPVVWRMVAEGLRWVIEYIVAKFRFLNSLQVPLPSNVANFGLNETKEIWVENHNWFPMVFDGALRNHLWEWKEIIGEKCHFNIYWEKGSKCSFVIVSPAVANTSVFEVVGVILPNRGKLYLRS